MFLKGKRKKKTFNLPIKNFLENYKKVEIERLLKNRFRNFFIRIQQFSTIEGGVKGGLSYRLIIDEKLRKKKKKNKRNTINRTPLTPL